MYKMMDLKLSMCGYYLPVLVIFRLQIYITIIDDETVQ